MPRTVIDVVYPSELGVIGLRGDTPPLSWTASVPPASVTRDPAGDHHRFELDFPEGLVIECKPIRDEHLWSGERNYALLAGESLTVSPHFQRATGLLMNGEPLIHSPELGYDIHYRVFVPPSYDEQHGERYPVLYAQDGQALFSAAPDPGDPHSWRMDDALNQLYEFGVVEQMIVVAVTTKERRIEMLSPTPDRIYGGGRADAYLDFLVRTLKPHVDAAWRTRPGRESTALIGASMGGLLSFYGAWTRGDVFGRAACLSASFWWDDRSMLRLAQAFCPAPRPWLYIDSGTALSQFEQDANVRDGFQHTQALVTALRSSCYGPASNLVSLAYAGFAHDASAWAARLAIPLQLLFPRRG